MISIPFVGQSYETDAIDISAQRTVNLYPEVFDDKNVKTVLSLKHTPGLLLKATQSYGNNKIRCLYQTVTGRLFSVMGNGVAEFSTAFAETTRFAITTGGTEPSSNIVHMTDNGVTILLTDGTAYAYTYVLSTDTATVMADADFPGGRFCGIIGGYYLCNKPNTTLIYYSDLDTPTSWSTLQTISKESTEDYVTSFIVSNNRIWAFGAKSHEVHSITTSSANRFLRIPGTESDIGIQAPDSLAENGDSVFWLGANARGFGQVYMSVGGGFQAISISTKPLETTIHGYTTTSDAEGYCYQQEGASFYVLSFPTENKTWVYDVTTGMWHERSYRNTSTGLDERHRGRVQAFFNGKNLLGDRDTGAIYEISTTTYTDNGDPIIRQRISPTHWNNLERVKYKSVQFDTETGVGLVTGQGIDPQIIFTWSNDGGHVYGNDYFLPAGKIGEYRKRVKLERLGSARARVWKLTYSEPTSFSIFNMFVELA